MSLAKWGFMIVVAAITCLGSEITESEVADSAITESNVLGIVRIDLQVNDSAQLDSPLPTLGIIEAAPPRPIAQTAIGAGLTGEAVLACLLGAYYLQLSRDAGENSWGLDKAIRTFGGVMVGVGIGSGITGIALLSLSSEKWKAYRAWEKGHPQISLQYQGNF